MVTAATYLCIHYVRTRIVRSYICIICLTHKQTSRWCSLVSPCQTIPTYLPLYGVRVCVSLCAWCVRFSVCVCVCVCCSLKPTEIQKEKYLKLEEIREELIIKLTLLLLPYVPLLEYLTSFIGRILMRENYTIKENLFLSKLISKKSYYLSLDYCIFSSHFIL